MGSCLVSTVFRHVQSTQKEENNNHMVRCEEEKEKMYGMAATGRRAGGEVQENGAADRDEEPVKSLATIQKKKSRRPRRCTHNSEGQRQLQGKDAPEGSDGRSSGCQVFETA